MGLKSKLSVHIEVKANKDLFHDVFRQKPHTVSTMCPVHIQGCEFLEGDVGTVGSKVYWKYTFDGKERTSKCLIEAVDEERKIITWKELEGDLLKEYESFAVSLHVEAEGEKDLVCWSLVYERPNENVPELTSFLQFFIDMTKAMDDHHKN